MGTYIRVAEGNMNLGDALSLGGSLGLAVQSYSRDAGFVGQDLNVLHGGRSTLGCYTEGLEDSLLADPARSEGSSW